jgi:hypothetical protein
LETLVISNNQLLGPLPPLLCDKEGLNGNGVNGVLSCDVIACPAGTWNWNGRALAPGRRCVSCPNQRFVGQIQCGDLVPFSSMAQVGEYMTAYSSPTSVLLFAFCSTALIAVAIYLLKATKVKGKKVKSKRQIKDGSVTLRNECFYDNDGIHDANDFGEDQEELEVMPYPTRICQSDDGHLPIDEPAPITPSSLRERRNKSPDDDPDTQDLWLDVPKIA